MRWSSTRSLDTQYRPPRTDRRRPLRAASGPKLASMLSSTSATRTGRTTGWISPASSFEMSRSVLIRSSIVCNPRSTWPTTMRGSGPIRISASAEIDSRAALRGWSRSWLAAARKRVFERLARSASSLAAVSAWFERSRLRISAVSSSVRERTWPSRVMAVWNRE